VPTVKGGRECYRRLWKWLLEQLDGIISIQDFDGEIHSTTVDDER
jgi:hypothetical protein